MVIGSKTFYTNGIVSGSDEYLKNTLHTTECPVIIVLEKFNFPSNIVLTYDGLAFSVFAIKQFANLFPELSSLKTILVYAEDEKHNLTDEVLIEELAARHFENLTITKLNSDHEYVVNNWLSEQKDSLLVSGMFGRSVISKIIRKRFISNIIMEHKTPVFIAHN